MAQKVLTSLVCDNCDREIPDAAEATTVTLKLTGERAHGMQVDLCVECGPKIKALMDKGRPVRVGRPAASTPSVTPSGKKRGRPSKAEVAAREAAAEAARVAGAAETPAPAPVETPEPSADSTAYVGQSNPDVTATFAETDAAPDDGHSIVRAAPQPTFSAGTGA